ncbi:hypothetical protein Tco_0915500 [Tanacetum coccineum]
MEECYKLLTNQVDDGLLKHNVSRPLPLGGPPVQVMIQTEFFFNKDLEYLDSATRMLMRFNKIHKFSDETLQQIDEALDYRVKEFRESFGTRKALLVEEYEKETTDFYREPNDDIFFVASSTSCVTDLILMLESVKRFLLKIGSTDHRFIKDGDELILSAESSYSHMLDIKISINFATKEDEPKASTTSDLILHQYVK